MFKNKKESKSLLFRMAIRESLFHRAIFCIHLQDRRQEMQQIIILNG